jgi:hypothetical protein
MWLNYLKNNELNCIAWFFTSIVEDIFNLTLLFTPPSLDIMFHPGRR